MNQNTDLKKKKYESRRKVFRKEKFFLIQCGLSRWVYCRVNHSAWDFKLPTVDIPKATPNRARDEAIGKNPGLAVLFSDDCSHISCMWQSLGVKLTARMSVLRCSRSHRESTDFPVSPVPGEYIKKTRFTIICLSLQHKTYPRTNILAATSKQATDN